MNRYTKFFLLFLMIVLLLLLCFNSLKNDNYNYNYELKERIISTKKQNDFFVTGIKSKNYLLSYDADLDSYFFSYDFDCSLINVISPYNVKYMINKVKDNQYSIFIYSDKYYQEKTITLLNIPIISINSVDEKLNNVLKRPPFFSSSVDIFLHDKEEFISNPLSYKISFNLYQSYYKPGSNIVNYRGVMTQRGRTSFLFEKKSYKINFDSSISLLGMARDDDWILDALYTDKSKIRNKLSSDLWNLINDNQEINNDLHGQFVEVFMDNNYLGLYVLKEKVDKKTTGVSNDGLLAKSVDHIAGMKVDNSDIIKYGDFSGDNILIKNFEVKYYTKESLNNFFSKLNVLFNSNKSYNLIFDTFYFDNYINYKIFLSFIYGVDNVTKNQYNSIDSKNSKILITPWDMDLTFGLKFDDQSLLYSSEDYESYDDYKWIDDCILNGMDEKTLFLMKKRYWELRKNVITMDTINSYLDNYEEILIESGAASRDSERWYEYDVQFEIEQIREWAKRRIEFLDEYFK